MSREGTVLWVTHLSTGAPAAGATVEIRRSPQSGGTGAGPFVANSAGVVTLTKEQFAPVALSEESAIVMVKLGDDWAYRPVNRTLSGYRYGAYVDDSTDDEPIGMVFTEARIYRPGDTVRMKGVVREPALHGTSTPVGAKVHVVVSGPEGESVADIEGVVSSFGTFAFDVKVPPAGRMGSYGIVARLGARDTGGLHGSFEVAEYRPSEFKVSAEPVPAKGARPGTYVRGDQLPGTSRGSSCSARPWRKPKRGTRSRAPPLRSRLLCRRALPAASAASRKGSPKRLRVRRSSPMGARFSMTTGF